MELYGSGRFYLRTKIELSMTKLYFASVSQIKLWRSSLDG